jgi:Protein of unknown function (DUF3726)
MSWSLNEIEAEVKKAVRGAGLSSGLSWGLAEEAAKAARWLAARGVDPMPALVDVLNRHDRGERITVALTVTDGGQWHAPAPLCPLTLGAALCDHARQIIAGGMAAGPVARPLLVVPFVARAARHLGSDLRITMDHDIWVLAADGRFATTSTADRAECTTLRCEAAVAPSTLTLRGVTSADVSIAPDAWERLQTFAARTYVPANERSRREGAGAGSIDND